jgi:CheY-like chemotaxis protein
MTGLEMARAVKDMPSLAQVPIILMGISEQRPEAMAAGCDGFLAKPFSTPDLLDALSL